jgi:hypothetical protein
VFSNFPKRLFRQQIASPATVRRGFKIKRFGALKKVGKLPRWAGD